MYLQNNINSFNETEKKNVYIYRRLSPYNEVCNLNLRV